MKTFSRNPWGAEPVKDFSFLCCPECSFKSKVETTFLQYASDSLPQAGKFVSKVKLRIIKPKKNVERPKHFMKIDDEEIEHELGNLASIVSLDSTKAADEFSPLNEIDINISEKSLDIDLNEITVCSPEDIPAEILCFSKTIEEYPCKCCDVT